MSYCCCMQKWCFPIEINHINIVVEYSLVKVHIGVLRRFKTNRDRRSMAVGIQPPSKFLMMLLLLWITNYLSNDDENNPLGRNNRNIQFWRQLVDETTPFATRTPASTSFIKTHRHIKLLNGIKTCLQYTVCLFHCRDALLLKYMYREEGRSSFS